MAEVVADASVAVHADVSPFVRELKRKLDPIVKGITKKAKVQIGADEDYMRRSVDQATKRISKRAKTNVSIGVDDRGSTGILSKIRSGLSALTDAALGASDGIAKGLGGAFSLLQSIAGPALLVVGAVVLIQLIGVVVTLTGVLAGLTAGLVAMAAIAAAAFGVFAVAAIPTVLRLIKAVQGGNKEIAKLPKNMQGAAKQVQGLKKSFDDFLKPLQGPIANLVGQFAKLGQSVLPMLTPIVQGMTAAFSGLAVKLAAGFQSTEMLTFFNILQTRGPAIFSNLTSAAGNFGLGLISVINTFAPFAESLSQKINRIAQSFREWASSVEGNNAIVNFINWVKTEGKKAFDGVKDFAKEIPGLLKNLASDDVKGDLKDLTTVITGLAKALDALGKAYRGVKDFFGGEGIKDRSAEYDKSKDFVSDEEKRAKGEKVPKRTPGLPTDPGAPAPAANVFGFNNINFGPLLAKVNQAGTVVRTGLGAAFTTARAVAGAATQGILMSLTGLVTQAPMRLATLGLTLFTAFTTAWTLANTAFTYGANVAGGIVGGLATRILGLLTPLVGRLSSVGGQMIRALGAGIDSARATAARAASVVAAVISNAFVGLANSAFGFGAGIGSSIAAGLRSAIDTVSNAAADLGKAVWKKLPHSPVQEGPLKILNQGYAGKQISRMVAEGITAGAPLIDKAMSAAVMPAARPGNTTKSVTTHTEHTPTFNVSSPSADPVQVAMATMRQYRLSGAF